MFLTFHVTTQLIVTANEVWKFFGLSNFMTITEMQPTSDTHCSAIRRDCQFFWNWQKVAHFCLYMYVTKWKPVK